MEIVHFKLSSNFKNKADRLFDNQREKLEKLFPTADIQHIGGTAIPNLLTKGDLDINIRVNKNDFLFAIRELKKIYEINQPNNWNENYASFKDDSLELTLGVQITVIDSFNDCFIKQRDVLLGNPKLVEEFNRLKISFEGKSMEDYRKAKSEFLERSDFTSNQVPTSSQMVS